jgi:hypothetical protein
MIRPVPTVTPSICGRTLAAPKLTAVARPNIVLGPGVTAPTHANQQKARSRVQLMPSSELMPEL